MRYKIVTGKDCMDLQRNVNGALESGWHLYGTYLIDQKASPPFRYSQAVIQHDDEEWGANVCISGNLE